MRLLLLAANDGDADAWIGWFVAMSPVVRTHWIDAQHTLITTVTPADDLNERLDSDHERWTRDLPIKVLRTDEARFSTEQRVISALARLAARYPVCDPTGLLGPQPEYLAARAGWMADERTAPMGTMRQQNRERPKRPVGRFKRSLTITS